MSDLIRGGRTTTGPTLNELRDTCNCKPELRVRTDQLSLPPLASLMSMSIGAVKYPAWYPSLEKKAELRRTGRSRCTRLEILNMD